MCRAKYPLATISQLLELLPPGIGIGYDIACSFTGTVARSSLDPQAWHLGLHMVVPAFHGHAHNRLCQLEYHIQMSSGFGLEDLETCEHVFASSNMVARLTRHATPFHRRQFIDMHFQHWDEEKYQSLGAVQSGVGYTCLTLVPGHFFLNNYKQALRIIRDMPIQIETLTLGCHIFDMQFRSWLNAEQEYLQSKQSEPEADVLGIEYVELLNKYNSAW